MDDFSEDGKESKGWIVVLFKGGERGGGGGGRGMLGQFPIKKQTDKQNSSKKSAENEIYKGIHRKIIKCFLLIRSSV